MVPTSATTAAQNPAARMDACSRLPIDSFVKSVIGRGLVSGPEVNDLAGPTTLVVVVVCGRLVIHVSPATNRAGQVLALHPDSNTRHQSR